MAKRDITESSAQFEAKWIQENIPTGSPDFHKRKVIEDERREQIILGATLDTFGVPILLRSGLEAVWRL